MNDNPKPAQEAVEQFRAELIKKLETLVQEANEVQRDSDSKKRRHRYMCYKYTYLKVIEMLKAQKP